MTYATLNDARIALREWRAAHMDESRNYSRDPYEDCLRSYLWSLEPGAEMDALEAAWDWALGGFVGESPLPEVRDSQSGPISTIGLWAGGTVPLL